MDSGCESMSDGDQVPKETNEFVLVQRKKKGKSRASTKFNEDIRNLLANPSQREEIENRDDVIK